MLWSSAVCRKLYILNDKKDTPLLLCSWYFSFYCCLHVRCGPGSFWAPPAKFKPTSLRRSNCDVSPSVVVVLVWFLLCLSFLCSCFIWRHIDFQLDVIWLWLTFIWRQWKRLESKGGKRKRTFATVFIPRECVWWVVGRVESGSVPS